MKVRTIRDYAQAFSGYAFSANDLVDVGYPVLKIGNIQNYHIEKETESFYNGEITEKIRKYQLQKDDFLIAMTGAGSVGRAGKMIDFEEGYLVNQRVAIIRPYIEKTDSRYLFYYFSMNYVEKYLYNLGIGAGQPNISANDILKTKVLFPELDKQRKIGEILSAYDELIENNNKRIKILEQMAENLYKEWFVRFRFPGHETTEFENGLPKGWKSCKLRDIASEVGKSINSDKRDTYNYYLPIDSIPNKSMGLTEVNDIENAESSLHTFKKGDILFGSMRPYFHKVLLAPFDGITRKTCFVINAKNKKYSDWLYLLMYQQSTVAFATTVCVGSTMPYVRPQDLFRMNIILPDENIVQAFSKKVSPILNRISLFFFENQNLIKQRDMLLPRLMSGKLEVGEKQEKVLKFKPKKTFVEFKNEFKAAARKDGGLTEQDLQELYRAYCDDSLDE